MGGLAMGTVGDRIKEAAGEVGGLNRLAALIGKPRRTLGNWLKGTKADPDSLAKIAEVTRTSLNYIVTGEGTLFDGRFAEAMERFAPPHSDSMAPEEFKDRADELFRRAMNRLGSDPVASSTAEEPAVPLVRTSDVGIDIMLLQRLGDVVEAVFVQAKQTPPRRAIVAEAGRLYNELLAIAPDITDSDVVEALIPVLRTRFKERITAAEHGSGKRSVS
jgi:hypothetical protein